MEADIYKQNLKGWRAEVGMLSPVSTMFREYEVVAPEGIRFSRALLGLKEVTPEALRKMAENIPSESEKLCIGHKPNLICLGCTSGSFVGGPGYDQTIIKKIEKATGGKHSRILACKACSDRYGISDKMFKLGFEVVHVGDITSLYIKSGYRIWNW